MFFMHSFSGFDAFYDRYFFFKTHHLKGSDNLSTFLPGEITYNVTINDVSTRDERKHNFKIHTLLLYNINITLTKRISEEPKISVQSSPSAEVKNCFSNASIRNIRRSNEQKMISVFGGLSECE